MFKALKRYNLSIKHLFRKACCKQAKNNNNKMSIISCLYKQIVLTLQSKDYIT